MNAIKQRGCQDDFDAGAARGMWIPTNHFRGQRRSRRNAPSPARITHGQSNIAMCMRRRTAVRQGCVHAADKKEGPESLACAGLNLTRVSASAPHSNDWIGSERAVSHNKLRPHSKGAHHDNCSLVDELRSSRTARAMCCRSLKL
eukprot:6176877-Pleurochrysis_carterae.AAC.2